MTYEKGFKEEAARLSEEIGVKNTAEQLGISYNTLSQWRSSCSRYCLTAASVKARTTTGGISSRFPAVSDVISPAFNASNIAIFIRSGATWLESL